MKPAVRYLLASFSFAVVIYLLITTDFADRGYHFVREAEATGRSAAPSGYDLSKLRILTRAVGYIRSYYVEPDRVEPREMIASGLTSVQRLVPPLLVRVVRDEDGDATSVGLTLYEASRDFALDKVTDLYEMNWKMLDIFEFLERHLRHRDGIDEVEYAAINGMLETLDPHSVMLDPDVYAEMKLGTSGEFGGLGIVVSIRESQLTVVNVMEDTPAFTAGLARGDHIVQIGEESTVNMSLNEAVSRLRGTPGTRVTVWIARNGWTEPRSFRIERSKIAIKSVEAQPLGRGVGYVRVKNFQQNTTDDLVAALDTLRTSGHARGLILDLRENPGGLLEQAISVSDIFLGSGTIVATVGSAERLRDEKRATPGEPFEAVPLVVLVNAGSASASEIVAGALQNNGRGIVMGDRTFGKGSVQVLYDIDEGALKLTVAHYLTPGEQSIQTVGIEPDIRMIPAIVDKDEIDLFATDRDTFGERKLHRHLDQPNGNGGSRAAISVKYLDEEPPKREPSEEPDLRDDKLVRYAEALLTRTVSGSRDEMLPVARELFAELQREEARRIRLALAERNIDWRSGPGDDAAFDAGSLSVETPDAEEGTRVRAGEDATLRVRVRNRGATPVYRIHAITRAENNAFDNRELLFGLIPPGEAREWSVSVPIPTDAPRSHDEVVVELFSDGRPLDLRKVVACDVEARPITDFAFLVQVLDDDDGNGDGLIQRGERFTLRTYVRNVGEGTVERGSVRVKNESGEAVYTHKGRGRLRDLEKGKETHVDFDMEVRTSLTEDLMRLRFTLVDTRLFRRFVRELDLPVGPPSSQAPEPVDWVGRVRSGPASVFGGADESALLLGELAMGSAVHVDRDAGHYVRVLLRDERWGWVRAQELERRPADSPTQVDFREAPGEAPPRIRLDEQTRATVVTDRDTIVVRGSVVHDGERGDLPLFIYVYRGEDKLTVQELEPPARGLFEAPVEVEVPVEPGQNEITVFAQIGARPPASVPLIVYRKGGAPPPIRDIR